ncbi:MAG: DeoR family transcriptional regulator [Paraglaciecola sp.]|uniref:DeoR/GlpR family DNA-binding transcription regulator n=1 Tax=Paraglaciecola sp. TaxID=1920173 RepID=UPI00273D933A|nr:DeoR family transcriptional regulator [Paraglaciecola sp.]MDP5030137.1 DeoR family transcriptional regulator [Paraglaciecola sp.]MDP5041318.1 DeoR family transcriptional regulator [Paraglaciecola sp.]MDP5130450.1 DeoR family transcriptional regulator [Paraglaciecola sp.]
MQKRNTQQRRRAIIECLNAKGEVLVDELSRQFSTSEVTIRKDLAELENNGLLLRKFGGAVLLPKDASELSSEKLSSRKMAIAYAAAELINDHNRIIIDSGSTTSALLPLLKSKLGLVVMTNSLQVSNYLLEQENEPKILMTGGSWDTQSHSFQGKMAELVLRSYNFDQAFLGAAGLDLEHGTTTFNELTQLSKVMAEVSGQVIVMAESEKLQRKIPNVELPWQSISILVTDDLISSEAKQRIEQHGVKVICAKPLKTES